MNQSYILSSFGCLHLHNDEIINSYLKKQKLYQETQCLQLPYNLEKMDPYPQITHCLQQLHSNVNPELRVRKCPYCNTYPPYTQSIRECKCGTFNKYKQKINRNFYISDSLRPEDEQGFCSAGIIPYFLDRDGTVFILLLEQFRTTNLGLNFAGGRRESYPDNNGILNPETSVQTAKCEFIEEVSCLINDKDIQLLNEIQESNLTKVLWTGKNKMALFFLKVKFNLTTLQHNQNIPKNSEAQNFYVMPIDEMFKFPNIYHGWAFEILKNLKYCFNGDLIDFFD
jgi:hypothetical protein